MVRRWAVHVQATDIHTVLYTSGTTGRPKGAMISHGAAAIRGLRLAQWFGLTPDDGFIGWLPLFHCGGDESLYATMLTGGTFGALRKADVETMFRMIERDRLSWTLLLPGVITDFLHHPRRADYDLATFRFAIGYANMMPNVIQQLTAACSIDFYAAFCGAVTRDADLSFRFAANRLPTSGSTFAYAVARRQPSGDEYRINDLGSGNGTKVNGKDVNTHVLLGNPDVVVRPRARTSATRPTS